MAITVRELNSSDWRVLETLFGARGACGGCWCMVWRSAARGNAYRALLGEPNRKAFHALVKSGSVHGSLAFDGDLPVGWCSTGPRVSFPWLVRTESLNRDWDETTWSITCFYIRSEYRRVGVATKLCREAIRIARSHGARAIEAYPAVPYETDRPMPAAFAWTGVPALYERLRFSRLKRHGRPVYRKALRPHRKASAD